MNHAHRRTVFVLAATVLLTAGVTSSRTADPDRRRSPVVEVFEKSRDAVVNISTTRVIRMRSLGRHSPFDDPFDFALPRTRDQRVQSVGSGAIVHESGYIVTNAHVVAQASDVRVTFADGRTKTADIVAVDPEHDLAVLKLDGDRPLPALKLGRSSDIMVGETVVAIGNPLGLQHTVTAGIVSALHRDLEFNRDTTYRNLIQTDASINPGNSGGPLLNVNAELIGINTAIRGDAQNIGFAIPVDALWELLPAMLDVERHARVRFGLQVAGKDARVVAVRPDSPAAAADLKPGDRIARFDGDTVRDGIDYYVHLLAKNPGAEVKLTVHRGDQDVTATVPLQAIPLPDGQKLARQLIGVELGPIPARLRRHYDLPAHMGLIVEDVEANSPADDAGLQPGDVILRLDRVTAASLDDVGLTLEQTTPPDRVLLEGVRLQADPPFVWTVSVRTRR
ncbi:MAG: trypsin-like peptidase domain-containing protein [Phycisphaerae bacterium]|jgi:serine protease Do